MRLPDLRNIVQRIVDIITVVKTGQARWYPVAFFPRAQNGEVLGQLRIIAAGVATCCLMSSRYI